MPRNAVQPSGVLTLTTDFGVADHYAGSMRGAVASVAPQVRVMDISHEVPRFSVAEGAFAIAQAYDYYPQGTVHVVVVDPGVGTDRRPLAAMAGGHWFVAPDNGVLSQVFEKAGGFEARVIDARHGLGRLSQTFHGRDLFAPSGARLAGGLPFEEIGPLVSDPVLLPPVAVTESQGRVLHVDSFGNVVTSFLPVDLPGGGALVVRGQAVSARAESYAAVPANRLFLIEGSSGYIEISLNRGSAARRLSARAGDIVTAIEDGDRQPPQGPGQSAKEVS